MLSNRYWYWYVKHRARLSLNQSGTQEAKTHEAQITLDNLLRY
jgi:hypothetical protein